MTRRDRPAHRRPRRRSGSSPHQWTERDGERQKLFAGCFGIFGHGNVAGIGQALLQNELPALTRRRPRCPTCWPATSRPWCTPSVGLRPAEGPPPDLGLHRLGRPGLDEHAHRRRAGHDQPAPGAAAAVRHLRHAACPAPVLQELEPPYAGDVTVNDAFRPLSRFFDRVSRPEQLPSALLGAMRVLTDPAETGAVTIALPQDVQAEAFDWPVELFADADVARRPAAGRAGRHRRRRGGHPLGAAPDDRGRWWRALLRAPRRRCWRSASATGIPVGETQAGKGSLPHGHPQEMGAVGSTGTTAANALAARGRRRHRRRHPLERLHHRVADRLPGQRCSLRQRQRRRLRRRQARRAVRRRRRPRGAHRADRGPRRLRRRRRHYRDAPGRRCGARGTRRSRRPTTRRPRSPTRSPTGCSPRARCSARSTS